MLVARSGYIHLAEALRKAWRVFYPDEPDRQVPIREVEEIEAPLVKSEEEIHRHDKEVLARLQTALADGKLIAVAWSENGERYDVEARYWRFSPGSPLTNDGADTIETGYLKPLKDHVPMPLWHEPCFVEREAFTRWLENERGCRPPAERMSKAAKEPDQVAGLMKELQRRAMSGEIIKRGWKPETESLAGWAKNAFHERGYAAETIRKNQTLAAEYKKLTGRTP